MADIATPDGCWVEHEAYCCMTRGLCHTRLTWPALASLDKLQIRKWRRFVCQQLLKLMPHCTKGHSYVHDDKANLQLQVPLGCWASHPLTCQLFSSLASHWEPVTLVDGQYCNRYINWLPDEVPPYMVPTATYDGCMRNWLVQLLINCWPYFSMQHAFVTFNAFSNPAPPVSQLSVWLPRSSDWMDQAIKMDRILLATDGGKSGLFAGFDVEMASYSGQILSEATGPVSG